MNRSARFRNTRDGPVAAALAFALIVGCGFAWGQGAATTESTLDRAAALIQDRAFDRAVATLRELLATDPANRRAKELLAFALESKGDIESERKVRSELAAEFPDDAGIQAAYGRVLERSGVEKPALAGYLRARELSGGRSDPELDAAIDRLKGRTASELGTPVMMMSDPDATASRVQAGASVPIGPSPRLALLATHQTARGTTGAPEVGSDALALSIVLRHPSGSSMILGPRVQILAPPGGARRDVGVGGVLAGRAVLGRWFELAGGGEVETAWDESAVTVLHGGRTSAVEGYVYSRLFSGRLLLQAGARRRELSVMAADPASTERPKAWQTLLVGGADVVVWRKPGAAVRGEMLNDTLTAPVSSPVAVALGYRHYDVTSQVTPEFATQIGLAPRGSVDEASVAATVASPRGRVGFEMRGGVGRDRARDVPMWRAGGSLILAPTSLIRVTLGYEEATEYATGLTGRRRAGWLSLHVDL